MAKWKDLLQVDPTEWLLTEGQPWMRYRILLDLPDWLEDDPQAQAARAVAALYEQARLLRKPT